MNINFLVTGAGAPGIRGTLHSLKTSPFWDACSVVGVDINSMAVGKHFLDGFHHVPKVTDESYNDVLLEIAKKENIDLIIPQTTNEIAHFSLHQEHFKKHGIKVLVTSQSSMHIANNKAKLLSAFTDNGLSTPRYMLVKSIDELEMMAKKLDYPNNDFVIKLPVSNGSRGVRIISESRMSLDDFINEKPKTMTMTLAQITSMFEQANRFPELLVMEYLPGEEWSVDVFRSVQGHSCVVPRVRNIIRSGIAFKTTVQPNDQIVELVDRISIALDLTTVFGFQFKMSESNMPGLLECNPRVQGTMVASTFAGANVLAMGCSDMLNIKYNIPKKDEIKWRVGFDRLWGGLGVSDGQLLSEI